MTNSHMKKYEICTNALTPNTVDQHRMHNSSCNNHRSLLQTIIPHITINHFLMNNPPFSIKLFTHYPLNNPPFSTEKYIMIPLPPQTEKSTNPHGTTYYPNFTIQDLDYEICVKLGKFRPLTSFGQSIVKSIKNLEKCGCMFMN